jgi:hypothetical protein
VSLVGDSLVAMHLAAYRSAIEQAGCEARIDGLSSRSLRDGELCTPSRCGPQGLEVLRRWRAAGQLGSTVVVALGTNDAGLGGEDSWRASWASAMELSGGRRTVFVTPVGRGRLAAKRERYSAALRQWCAARGCTLADWARHPVALDASVYLDDAHLDARGTESRAALIASTLR